MASQIIKKLAIIAAVVVFSQSANAHTYFTSEITGADGTATFTAYTHSGVLYYNLTSADSTLLGNNATLVVKTPQKNTTAVTLISPVSPTSTNFVADSSPPAFGEFGTEDITAALLVPEVYGGIYDLFQYACKNELYLVVKAEDGDVFTAPVEYAPPEEEGEPSMHGATKTCEEASQPYKPTAPAPAPASAAPRNTLAASFVAVSGVFAAYFF